MGRLVVFSDSLEFKTKIDQTLREFCTEPVAYFSEVNGIEKYLKKSNDLTVVLVDGPKERNAFSQIFRHAFPMGLVRFKFNMPFGWRCSIETNANMRWFFFIQYIKQCIGKPKHSRSIKSITGNSRVLTKGKISSVYQSHTI